MGTISQVPETAAPHGNQARTLSNISATIAAKARPCRTYRWYLNEVETTTSLDPIARLRRTGEELPDSLRNELLALGTSVVADLISVNNLRPTKHWALSASRNTAMSEPFRF